MIEDNPAKRLGLFRNKLGLKQADLARALGMSQAGVGHLERGVRSLRQKHLEALADFYGLNPDWLLLGQGEMITHREGFTTRMGDERVTPVPPGKPQAGDFAVDDQEYVLLDVYSVTPSAGFGGQAEGEAVVDRIAFSTRWLQKRGVSGDLSGLVRIRGASMEPKISDGSLVLLDFTAKADPKEGPHVFRYNEDLFVKHLVPTVRTQHGAVSSFLVRSYNTDHEDWRIEGGDLSALDVIGRVVAAVEEF